MGLEQKGLFDVFVPRVSETEIKLRDVTKFMYGLDVYLSRELAEKESTAVNLSRTCPFKKDLFFSGRHFEVVSKEDLGYREPFSFIDEVKKAEYMLEIFGYLYSGEFVMIDNPDYSYVISALTTDELMQLSELHDEIIDIVEFDPKNYKKKGLVPLSVEELESLLMCS